MLVFTLIIIVLEMIPLIKKKRRKETAALLLLGAITLAYGYYYNTHMYTASLVNIMFKLYGMR